MKEPHSTIPTRLRLAALSTRAPTAFDVVPSPDRLQRLKEFLELSALRKVRLTGELTPEGKGDWRLTARLGATLVQPCAITLDPVTTRIDAPVTRHYAADWTAPAEAEAEMPDDDSVEGVPEVIDLLGLIEEELALAVPPFPRAPGAELGTMRAAPAGAEPLDDTAGGAHPFAALAALKAGKEGENDG